MKNYAVIQSKVKNYAGLQGKGKGYSRIMGKMKDYKKRLPGKPKDHAVSLLNISMPIFRTIVNSTQISCIYILHILI